MTKIRAQRPQRRRSILCKRNSRTSCCRRDCTTFLKRHGIEISAYVSKVGKIELAQTPSSLDLRKAEESIIRCPDPATAKRMISLIEKVKSEGDTVGGVITGVIRDVQPVWENPYSIVCMLN